MSWRDGVPATPRPVRHIPVRHIEDSVAGAALFVGSAGAPADSAGSPARRIVRFRPGWELIGAVDAMGAGTHQSHRQDTHTACGANSASISVRDQIVEDASLGVDTSLDWLQGSVACAVDVRPLLSWMLLDPLPSCSS